MQFLWLLISGAHFIAVIARRGAGDDTLIGVILFSINHRNGMPFVLAGMIFSKAANYNLDRRMA